MGIKKKVRKPGNLKIIVTTPGGKRWDRPGWERITSAGIHKNEVPQYWDNGSKRVPIAPSVVEELHGPFKQGNAYVFSK